MQKNQNTLKVVFSVLALSLSFTSLAFAETKPLDEVVIGVAPGEETPDVAPTESNPTAIVYTVESVSELCAETLAKDITAESDLGTGTSLGNFKLTGYCSCRKCQGPWGMLTALGNEVVENHTVAVDSSVIPLGTWLDINIPGVGWKRYRAEDTGSGVDGKHIDIYVGSTHSNCYLPEYNGYAEVRLAPNQNL